jgi:hypothetical protein
MAVTNSGRIVGEAIIERGAHFHYFLVSWANAFAHYQVVRDFFGYNPAPTADARGDIGYAGRDANGHVITPDGHVKLLAAKFGAYPEGGAGDFIAGVDSENKLVRWDVPAAIGDVVTPEVLTPPVGNAWVTAVGARGDIVSGLRPPGHLRTAFGAFLRMPPTVPYVAGQAIGAHGVVAYTARSDARPHFLRCRPA